MRSLFILLVVAPCCFADLVASPVSGVIQTFFNAVGPVSGVTMNMTEESPSIVGSISLSEDESTVTYADITWARPAMSSSRLVDGLDVEVTVDAITVSQAVTPLIEPVISNSAFPPFEIETSGIPSLASFSHPNMSGTWRITGPLGTVESGAWNFPVFIQDLAFGETLDVTSKAAGVTHAFQVIDGVNSTTGSIALPVFDGVVDGVPVELRWNGGANVLTFSTAAAIPEPSAFWLVGLLLSASSAALKWRRRVV